MIRESSFHGSRITRPTGWIMVDRSVSAATRESETLSSRPDNLGRVDVAWLS